MEDGFVYFPLIDYGVTDSFAVRIQASSGTGASSEVENNGTQKSPEDDDEEPSSGNGNLGESSQNPCEPWPDCGIEDDDCAVGDPGC